MKAAILSRYGAPDVIGIKDVKEPVPGATEVLIKVRAASVNPLDWHTMRGAPYLARMMGGLANPKDKRLGIDVAGEVEAIGKDVTHFKPGDAVFGMCKGAFAEYACASATASGMSVLAVKREHLTFEQAAAIPVAAFTALQGLRDKGRIQAGHKVLINGASGGVGTFAVQLAKSFGADVTGVCGSKNVDMVRSLGADRVIDYTREDFTAKGSCYDLFLDCIGNRSLFACTRVLSPKGTYIVVSGPDGRWLGPVSRMLKALVLSPFQSQNLVPFIAKPNKEDLAILQALIESRKVVPVIDRRYRLSDVAQAIRYLEEGHARGKVVIIP